MIQTTDEIHGQFRCGFRIEHRVALVQAAEHAHRAALALVKHAGFSASQARDVSPHIMRAAMETRLASLALQGSDANVLKNSRGTSSFVEISTATAVLTALTRSQPPRQLPSAEYRNTRAKASQLNLFATPNDAPPEEKLYAVFVYGGGEEELGFAHVYFPVPGQRLRVIPPLNLLAEYRSMLLSDDAAANDTRPIETAKDARPAEETAKVKMSLKRRLVEEAE